MLLLLTGLRLWWGWEAKRRLNAKIAEYQAAGQPTLPDDFILPPVPDDDNAALDHRVAAKVFVAGEFAADQERVMLEPEAAADFVVRNAEALNLLHRARAKPHADWRQRWKSRLISAMPPDLSDVRSLLDRAVVLRFRALATRRMAATALAMRLFELDHGRRPARLVDRKSLTRFTRAPERWNRYGRRAWLVCTSDPR